MSTKKGKNLVTKNLQSMMGGERLVLHSSNPEVIQQVTQTPEKSKSLILEDNKDNKVDTYSKVRNENTSDAYKPEVKVQPQIVKKEVKVFKRRQRGGPFRLKFTTTLQPKYLEMLDECSGKEGFNDLNVYMEHIFQIYADKLGYKVEE